MTKDPDQKPAGQTRISPRAAVALAVTVDVEGEKRKVRLMSKDIGTGGIFLRTDDPAPLWKKVRLLLELPGGGTFEVGGEVVRSLGPDKAKEIKQPAGMAVAFDEISRGKSKELVALVLALCAKQVELPAKSAKPPASAPPRAPGKEAEMLLDELDSLLEDVQSAAPPLAAGRPADPEKPRMPAPAAAGPLLAPSGDHEKRMQEIRQVLARYQQDLKGETHYDSLGVSLKATTAEIEAGYKTLMAQLKLPVSAERVPQDLLGELTPVINKIKSAFAILSKPDRKNAYDFLIDNNLDDFLV